jgi:hypothetical protein
MTDPRPVREGDSLGRAGRLNEKGKPIRTERLREPTALDERHHATVDVVGVESPRIVVTSAPPLVDENGEPLPVVQRKRDGNRGLQHLDGESEPRPPAAWEKANAEIRAGKFAGEREAMTRALQRERDKIPLPQRLERLLQDLLVIQSQGATQVRATDARSAEGRDRAPQGEGHGAIGHLDPHEVDRRLQQIRLHLEAVEEMLDVHHGRAQLSYVLMGKLDKDLLLLGPKFRGLSPEEINAIHPELGAPRTIRFIRSEGGQTSRGLPKPEKTERAA